MKRNVLCLLLTASVALSPTLSAEPTAKTRHRHASTKSGDHSAAAKALIESANGWTYVKGEWVHPEGYKFVNGKVLRTTAKTGKAFPKPPGKLALENPQKLTPESNSAAINRVPNDTQSPAEKSAQERQKNLEVRPASQTGSHL